MHKENNYNFRNNTLNCKRYKTFKTIFKIFTLLYVNNFKKLLPKCQYEEMNMYT